MIKKIKMLFAVLFSALALFVVTAEPSYAGDKITPQENPALSIANTMKLVKESAIKISEKLSERATELLWGLALISLSFLAIKQIFSGADFNTLFAEIVKFIMTIGFFVFILNPKYVGVGKLITFVEDWLNIIPTGGASNHTPEAFIKNMFVAGWRVLCYVASLGKNVMILDFIMPGIMEGGFCAYALSLLVAIAIFILFLCMTANFILTLAKAYITICCGVLAVGFGGLTWTNSWAVNYLKQLVKLGFELMCFVFIVNVLLNMILTVINQPALQNRPMYLSEAFVIFAESLLIFILAHSVPPALVSMIEGHDTKSSDMSPVAQGAMVMKTGSLAMKTGSLAKKGASKMYARLKGGKGNIDVKPNSPSSNSSSPSSSSDSKE